MVFGNGRTHTGEVDGSGGSRLANYCLRAPIKGGDPDERRDICAGVGGFGSMSEWLMVAKGEVKPFLLCAPQPQSSSDSMIRRSGGIRSRRYPRINA